MPLWRLSPTPSSPRRIPLNWSPAVIRWADAAAFWHSENGIQNQTFVESYVLFIATLYSNSRKPNAIERLEQLIKGLIMKFDATAASLGVIITDYCSLLVRRDSSVRSTRGQESSSSSDAFGLSGDVCLTSGLHAEQRGFSSCTTTCWSFAIYQCCNSAPTQTRSSVLGSTPLLTCCSRYYANRYTIGRANKRYCYNLSPKSLRYFSLIYNSLISTIIFNVIYYRSVKVVSMWHPLTGSWKSTCTTYMKSRYVIMSMKIIFH